MTSLRPTLRIAGFQSSLKQALAPENLLLMAQSLRRDVQRPERITDEDWVGIRASIRFAYQAASQDGLDAVLADVRDVMKDQLSDDELDRLASLITPTEEVDRRQEGVRVREGFLPNLIGASLTLDLRVVEPKGDQGPAVEVVPVVLARLELDEQIGGQEAVVFQLSGLTLDEFMADLTKLQDGLRALTARDTPTITVPEWARDAGEQ
jgi:hypothetical protein